MTFPLHKPKTEVTQRAKASNLFNNKSKFKPVFDSSSSQYQVENHNNPATDAPAITQTSNSGPSQPLARMENNVMTLKIST